MISVIISSYNRDYFRNLEQNIGHTIGVPYEIIRIDNDRRMGAAQAYNIGAERARYEFLCFMHEDVRIHTPWWGPLLVACFKKNPDTGIIGVAGSKAKLPLPTGWFTMLKRYDRRHLIESNGTSSKVFKKRWSDAIKKVPVRVLDGVFLFTSHKVWSKFKFDEQLTGYHFYDVDFSLRVSESHTNYVTSELLLEHFSSGNFGDEWVAAAIEYHKRMKGSPLFDRIPEHSLVRANWYRFLSKQEISLSNRINYLYSMGFDRYYLSETRRFIFRNLSRID